MFSLIRFEKFLIYKTVNRESVVWWHIICLMKINRKNCTYTSRRCRISITSASYRTKSKFNKIPRRRRLCINGIPFSNHQNNVFVLEVLTQLSIAIIVANSTKYFTIIFNVAMILNFWVYIQNKMCLLKLSMSFSADTDTDQLTVSYSHNGFQSLSLLNLILTVSENIQYLVRIVSIFTILTIIKKFQNINDNKA